MAVRWERSFLIQQVIQENPQVRSFRCEFGLSRFHFWPGQFAVVRHLERPEVRASLTFSTGPDDEHFEFTLKRSGDFGTRVYDEAKAGDLLCITQPAGGVALQPAHLGAPVCFIGRDHCVPAARGFLRWLKGQPGVHPLTVIHELSSPEESLYSEEFASFVNAQQLRYKPLPAESLSTDMLDELFADSETPWFFVHGEASDARRFRELLQLRGVSKERMLVERWS